MSNMIAVIIYIVFLIFTVGAMISTISKKNKITEEFLFIFLAAMVTGWTIMYIIWDLAENVEMLRFYYSLFYPFIAFVPPILLTLTNKFYRVRIQIPKFITVILFVFPVLVTVMALTTNFHNLIFTAFDVLETAPVRKVFLEYGVGFWIHTSYCYIITMISVGFIVFYFFKTPKYNRFSLILFACGIAVSLFGNIFTLMHIFPVSLDPTLLFANISVAFYYFAIISNTKLYFINFSRQWIFEQIDDIILVLDINGIVVDCNNKAKNWFATQKINLNDQLFSDIINKFITKTHHYFEDHNPEEVEIDYVFETDQKIYIFFMRKNSITDHRNNVIGSVIIFNDVTQSRLLQEKLEYRAGIDALTGINNRMSFERAHKQLDNELYLPLGIIICDVNGLKNINDTLGHSYGDIMLKDASKILENCCPPKGFFARIGGDEFIFLLPNTKIETVEEVIKTAREKLASYKGEYFNLEVAIGFSVKRKTDENFNDVFLIADQRMYQNKKEIKEKIQHL